MRIIVDGMGSDDHPGPDVEGAVRAARKWSLDITLVGDRDILQNELAKHDSSGLTIDVLHASEAIAMKDKPGDAAKHKQDSSMHVGLRLVKEGEGDAFVSAGNTGAILAIALLQSLGRIKGIKRPALAALFPNLIGYTLLTDFGANSDCRPEWLLQFASMANIYAQRAIGLESPRVALLSNGEEEGKGNDLVRETEPLIKELKSINYVGVAEPKEVMFGETDIAVSDGFVGNIMGKSLEAMGMLIARKLKDEIMAGPITTLGGALVKPAIDRLKIQLDPANEIGGIPLLGVDGVVIIAHGRSGPHAMMNAIGQAMRVKDNQVVDAIREDVG